MSTASDLERDIESTRSRLNGTIERIQEKLTVSGIVDEVMGQAGVPKMASGHDFVLSLLRRHPVPVMIAAAGLGFAIYQINKRSAARDASLRLEADVENSEVIPRLPRDNGRVRVYAPDLSLTNPSTDPDGRPGL